MRRFAVRNTPFLIFALLAGTIASACVSPRPGVSDIEVEPEIVQSTTRFSKEYVLAAGDTLEVVVRRFPEISRTVVVRPDGFISLPLLDDVVAAGLTPRELDERITAGLVGRIIDPEVTVIAAAVRQPSVYVVGDVNNNAAVVPLREAPTAMHAITFAGGLRRTAATRDITIIRLSLDGHLQAIPVPAAVSGQPGPYMAMRQMPLRADDIILVPENQRSQFARLMDDFVTRPLTGINQVLGVWVNFRFIEQLSD